MLAHYERLVVALILKKDPKQLAALSGPLMRLPHGHTQGVYLHGPVGTGKTLLMDIWVNHCREQGHHVLRTNFHKFMLDVHARIHRSRGGETHVVIDVAREFSNVAKMVAFDEFQVTDIADAMILKTILETLFEEGVTFITTSNRPPDELYKGGVNRERFLSTIDLLKARCGIVNMGWDDAKDYRLEKPKELHKQTFFVDDANVFERIESLWHSAGGEYQFRINLDAGSGRNFVVERATKRAARFTFDDLCTEARGAADYYPIASNFDMIIITGIPLFSTRTHNEARRLITLIDAAYENLVTLVLTAAASSAEELFADLIQNTVVLNRDNPVGPNPAIDDNEWDGTGNWGVSAFALSSVEEVKFAYARAVSRLAEMQSVEYLRRSKGFSLLI